MPLQEIGNDDNPVVISGERCSPLNDPVYQGENRVPYQMIGVHAAWNYISYLIKATVGAAGDKGADDKIDVQGRAHSAAVQRSIWTGPATSTGRSTSSTRRTCRRL